MPFVWRELQNRPFGVPAVANADTAAPLLRHLNALAVENLSELLSLTTSICTSRRIGTLA